ncbi:L-serine ammonia-lyase, iron-sulfur-dependent subunit beta [Paenibacillus sp. P96]|uniref:L-serine deaminase n=1 Tax=Paenibacillus zeirhizosphaerae TaxID=2987519 RepID=A0ABT9FMU2_9BACL|nr:L-serine ammonia-lyase, iron-sulfur-dependent subunit beta [Paenibacillus sp. P96]MDP4096052.1 L-serine ammonia-lyase, iron-sulfur-dependent subunit beta [Paenibacillus sp. P96]
MRFKDVFSIIGPAMTGPSSSHTAGAVRLGRMARHWLGGLPEQAKMTLYGSFADTYKGHGTDLALLGGLLDYETDDARIQDAEHWAQEAGMAFEFVTSGLPAPHPNTVRLELQRGGEKRTLLGSSIGGGNVNVQQLNEFRVNLTGELPALILLHSDKPGMLGSVTSALGAAGVNIAYMHVDRKGRDGEALTAIETDSTVPDQLITELQSLTHMYEVRNMDIRGKSKRQ